MKLNVSKLFWSLVITFAVGMLGSLATSPEIGAWYVTLIKPSFNPPNWVFAPVWTTLYILMAVGLYLVWNRPKSVEQEQAMLAYWIQLALNMLWSFVFFRWHQLGWALVDVIVLWLAILWTIMKFRKVDATAAYLLWPYLGWVTFASFLNFTLWRLN